MQFTQAVAPESIGQQFFRSLKLYLKSFFHIFPFGLGLAIIAFIPRLISLYAGQEFLVPTSIWNLKSLLLLGIDICGLIFFTAMLWRIKCLIISRKDSIWEDFKTAVKKTPYILVAVIIQAFLFILINIISYGLYMLAGLRHMDPTAPVSVNWAIGGVFVFQGMATVYIYFLFYFYLALILTEDKTALSSLKQSVVLVWKNWWRTFWVQVLPWICYLLILVAIRNVFNLDIRIYFLHNAGLNAYISMLQIVLFAVFIPWPAATVLVQLRDLELRKKP